MVENKKSNNNDEFIDQDHRSSITRLFSKFQSEMNSFFPHSNKNLTEVFSISFLFDPL